MKPKALLIYPPIYDFAAFDLFVKPYALLKIGAWLSAAGYDVSLVNALDYRDPGSVARLGTPKRRSDGTGKFFRQTIPTPQALSFMPRFYSRYGVVEETFTARIRAEAPDIVLIGSGMTYWYPGVIETVRRVREAHPRVPIVVGGVYATLCPDHAHSNTGADHVAAGPAEYALPPILSSLELPVPAGPLPAAQLPCLEGIRDAAAVRLHRGCPLSCAYCASRTVSGSFQAGSGEALFEEVAALHRRFGIRDFGFYDDALLSHAGSGIIPFLEAVIRSALPLRFHVPNGLHVSLITKEIARLMKQGGVMNFRLGLESSAASFHEKLDLKVTEESFRRAVSALGAAGFRPDEIAVYILAGLPRQDPEEVEGSVRFAAAFGVRVFIAEYSPIPGSPLWEESVAASPFPIAEEPLCQNNTIFPLQWDRFGPDQMQRLKDLARSLTRARACAQ
ncbi:MAG TPA: radical SAM protein [Spirochaetia bacterium]|nr:radical SAM protein [Spirochaetia bacterium]